MWCQPFVGDGAEICCALKNLITGEHTEKQMTALEMVYSAFKGIGTYSTVKLYYRMDEEIRILFYYMDHYCALKWEKTPE